MGLPVIEPMLATRWHAVTDEPGWIHEIKWDGVRAIVSGDGAIRSRRGNRIETGYPELAGVVPPDSIVDGEIVAFDEHGAPSFQTLQRRMHVRDPSAALVARVPVALMVFDLLHRGSSLLQAPWEERRGMLEEITFPVPVRLVDVHDDGPALFDAARSLGIEGVVSKRHRSPYRPGWRSEDWRKVAHRTTCQAVVIGSLPGTGGRSVTFGSLALGLWLDDGRIRFIGSVGSGFDHSSLSAIDRALAEMETGEPPPLEEAIPQSVPVRWVTPTLVAVVEYTSWTADGRLRSPVFKGFSATPVDEVTWTAEGPV